jgi:hypothetical protein
VKGCNSRQSNKISILSINVNSLRGKAIRLLELIHREQPDIILCQETKLDVSVLSSELFPSEYTVCRKDRNLDGGGVSIAIINKLKFIECTDLNNNTEAVWINLQTADHSPVYICSFYRPPDMKVEYTELLRQPLELISAKHHNKLPLVIIAGDFNYPDIDWPTSSAPSGSAGGNFIDILNDFHLHQLVSQPTRFCKTTSSVLDLVTCSYPASIESLYVGDEFSDHCVISFKVSLAADMNISKPRKIFLYNRGDYNQLRSELHSFKDSFLASVPRNRTVDQNWIIFKKALAAAVAKAIPSKLSTSGNKRPSWLTSPVRRAIHKRDKLSHQAKKSGNQIDRDKYRKARNQASQAIESAYQTKLNGIIGNVKSDPRGFYRFIKSKKNESTTISSLRSNNAIVSDDKSKATCLNDYFASVFTQENDSPFPKPTNYQSLMPNIEVTTFGVQKLLSNLDPKKSVGPDEISPRILKESSEEITPVLTFIFNQSLSTGEIPDDWLIANIFPLHKKGPKDLPENYRPISLTSVCSKVMEHIIHSCICRFLEENQVLTPRQHGFRSGHSCETQLILSINDWAKSMDSGLRTDVAIFDFSKAFDSVPHSRLLSKIESYGIQSSTLRWIQSFLTNRRQRVIINGSLSSWKPVTSGVPQGTVLGPLLFLLYINDITKGINSEIRLFADDCILYRQIVSDTDTVKLQEDISKLHSWSLTWQMSFNTKKCHILSISRQRRKPVLAYKIGPDNLTAVDSYPYLGVTISSDLRWNIHINNVCARATRTLNFIRRNIYRCPPDSKSLAYTSLVRPHLEYASGAWDPHTAKNINSLEMVQRRAARFVKRDYRRTTSASSLTDGLGWSTLSSRRKSSRLCSFYKAYNRLSPISLDHLVQPSRSTRSSVDGSCFLTLSSHTDVYKYSFFTRTIIDWNALSSDQRLKTSIDAFRGGLLHCY